MYLDKNKFKSRRAIAYLRKSTDDAYRQKYSIQAQKEQVIAWTDAFEVILEEFFIDDHSAKDFHRPGWEKLMTYLTGHHKYVDLVLIVDYSRFSRNDVLAYVSINQLDQWGVELQAIDQLLNYDVPESLIMRGNYITMPAVDNRWRSIKVKRGMTQSLKSGNWCGGKLPRGYWRDRNTETVLINDDGELIGHAFKKIALHGYSIKDAMVYLNVRGVNITFKALSKLLRNPFYKGMISHKLLGDEIVQGKHQPIVSQEIWSQVNDIISGNKKSGKTDDIFPLKKFLTCPECNQKYTGYMVKKKQRKDGSYREKKSKPIYYKCKCGTVSGKMLHEYFTDILSDHCLDPGLVPVLREKLIIAYSQVQAQTIQSLSILRKRKTEKQAFMENLELKFIDGKIDSDTYMRHKEKAKLELQKMEEEIERTQKISNPSKLIDHSMKLITKMDDLWKNGSLSVQKRIQSIVFPDGLYYSKLTGQYLTPRLNSIFTVISSLSGNKNKKTRPETHSNLVYSPLAVRTDHKSNPIYIEDFLAIIEENQLS